MQTPSLAAGTQGWSSVLLSPVSGWPAVGSCLAPLGSPLFWWAQLVLGWPCALLLLSLQISSDRPPLAGKAPGKEAVLMLVEQKSWDQKLPPFCCLRAEGDGNSETKMTLSPSLTGPSWANPDHPIHSCFPSSLWSWCHRSSNLLLLHNDCTHFPRLLLGIQTECKGRQWWQPTHRGAAVQRFAVVGKKRPDPFWEMPVKSPETLTVAYCCWVTLASRTGLSDEEPVIFIFPSRSAEG